MIKGLAVTPPVLGRISIGRVEEKNGKKIPVKEDQFTITSQVQNHEGFITHPLDEEFRKSSANGKIRSIPIRVIFNDPELTLQASYSCFDRTTGRPLCVGNGETCKRFAASGIESLPCPSPDACEFSKGGLCKPYGRLNIQIGDEDDLGAFVFRTTGFNSIRSLTARLHYYQAVSGNLLACLPLELRLRGKSTAMSYRSAIYYVDITIRDGLTLEQAIAVARENDTRRKSVGYDQAALDTAARRGFSNGAFEDSEEEIVEFISEFLPELNASSERQKPQGNGTADISKSKPNLLTKLDNKLADRSSSILADGVIPGN
jgi:hypothetical protein